MRKITDTNEIRLIMLDILKYIDSLCKENNLEYYLYGGTLLGSIRHKGFIPWDDDLDICMPRPDYNKLIKIMQDTNEEYSLKCIENSKKEYNYCFAKMIKNNTVVIEKGKFQGEELGVWVDIFPLDGVGNDLKKARELVKNNKRFVKQILMLEEGKKLNTKGKIFYYLGRKNINRIFKHYTKKHSFYNSKYVADISDVADDIWIFNKKSFEGGEKGLFEGIEFNIPKDSDDILKTLYGNYMELPPEEERTPIHNCEVWIK